MAAGRWATAWPQGPPFAGEPAGESTSCFLRAVDGSLNQYLIRELLSDSKFWGRHHLPHHPACLGAKRGEGKTRPICSCPRFD